MKKALLVFLASALFTACVAVTAFLLPTPSESLDAIEHAKDVTDGNILYRYTDYNDCYFAMPNPDVSPASITDVLIKGTVNGKVVDSVRDFNSFTSLRTLKIEDGVTSISGSAFENCASLCEVSLPKSIKYIFGGAFSGCDSLETVSISGASIELIDCSVFEECANLTEIVGEYSMASIGYKAFAGCENLRFINLVNTERIGAFAFYKCASLEGICIGDKTVHIGDGAFAACNGMKGPFVSAGNKYYTSYGGAIYSDNRTVLVQYVGTDTEYTVPSSVREIAPFAFYENESITEITFITGLRVVNNYAFTGCSSLKSLTFPSNIKRIGYNAFVGCSSLEEVIFEDPDGWYAAMRFGESPIDKDTLAAPQTAAKALTETYGDKILTKKKK